MNIDLNSAVILVDSEGATPGTNQSADKKSVFLHMTRNWSAATAKEPGTTDEVAQAIGFEGWIDVRFDSKEQRSGYQFRFVQLAKTVTAVWMYAGRKREHGSIWMNLAAPPAHSTKFVNQFCIDAEPGAFGDAVMPFTNLREQSYFPAMKNLHAVPGSTTVSTKMFDHPFSKGRSQMVNRKTGELNRLLYAAHDSRFLTTFVVRNECTKAITPLAHVGWRVAWKARYRWNGDACLLSMVEKTLDMSKSVKGPPKDKDLAARVTKPNMTKSETSNALMKAAIKALDPVASGQQTISPLVFVFADAWPPDMPQDFWT